MNNMQKMRQSNSKARQFLKSAGFQNVHIVPHTRWSKDITIDGIGFDGVCTNACRLFFIQIKTNAWPPRDEYMSFVRIYGNPVLLINVKPSGVFADVIIARGNVISCENVETVEGVGWINV